MKSAVLLAFCLACSVQTVEPVGEQHEAWFNQCHFDYEPLDPIKCMNGLHFHCDDGASQWLLVSAPASNWIGQTCMQTPDHTYVYVCVLDTTTERYEVRCNN